MTYCDCCKKPTNDKLTKEKWNLEYNMVYIHCEECLKYKGRYLEKRNDK